MQEDESSESESVSGGDDELVAEVNVPASVRKNIKFDILEDEDEGCRDEKGNEVSTATEEQEQEQEEREEESGTPSTVKVEEVAMSTDDELGSAASAGGVIGLETSLVEGLTGITQTKNMAALSKLRKLKQQKVSSVVSQ